MEAIGAGANLLAFVLFALKSAKTAYETLSAIKDGPQIVKQVANTVNQLCWILENIKESRVSAEDVSLLGHLRICREDLELAASWIEKLQISSIERQSGRLWRRLKCFLSEKDLERFNTQLIGHVTTLNLRLQGTSSNIVHELRHDHVQFEQTIGALSETVQTQTCVQETNFSSLRQGISDALNTQSETIRTGLDTLHGSIAALTSMSQPQGQSMLDLLQEIKGLIITSTQPNQAYAAESSCAESILSPASPSESRNQETTDEDTELIDSIDRLCDLVHDKGRIIDTYSDDNEESRGIIQNLQTILQSASERGQVINWNTTHSKPGESSKEEFKRISRRFERAFDQYRIAVNQGVTIRKCSSDKVMKRIRGYQEIRMKVGTLALMFDHCKWSKKAVNPGRDLSEDAHSDYTISCTFLPDDPRRFHMLVGSTFQREIERGAVSSISRLAVNRVLPPESRVFKVVLDGDLHELQRMLRDGEASLRDHDEDGASLLSYSMLQPTVCKYLLENGLDVDHVIWGDPYTDTNTDTNVTRHPWCALQLSVGCMVSRPDDIDTFLRIQSFCRILLEAGADPTLDVGELGSFLSMASILGSPELKRLAWNPELTGYAASIKTFTEKGVPLLLFLLRHGLGDNLEGYKELLNLGADIHARDPEFRTCLHLYFKKPPLFIDSHEHRRKKQFMRAFKTLEMLIERGADPQACDSNGDSVSDYAYDAGRASLMGSCVGDLWDSVLQSSGREISEFRTQDCPRIAIYNSRYSRNDFEFLWKGREHLCPYWDDSPWPRRGEDSTNLNKAEVVSDSDPEVSEDWNSDSDSEVGGAPI
ncbi:ankyrin [Hypoxylon sp. FL1857]|nr:ankyrin [Hypoxylon sp. FL1857]